MNSKWMWLFPYANGIIVGAILFAANGFDFAAVMGAWIFIGAVLILYTAVLRAVPVRNTTLRLRARRPKQRRADAPVTPVQARYLQATSQQAPGGTGR
jgi:NADH:ubiquinone oxidoreductase subunit 6 (subunit J)